MTDYRSLYKSYYSKTLENNNSKIEDKHNVDNYFRVNKKEKSGIIKRLMFQIIGAVLLILIAIIAKNSKSEDVQQAFANVKAEINKKYKIEFLDNIKDDLSEYIKEFKEKINKDNLF
ncbi:MAG: hypothetical protein MR691_07855 [Clostridium sp.]|nr:hypothetical protein [Clostridium sp.]